MKLDKRKLEIAMARAMFSREDLASKAELSVNTVGNVYSRAKCRPWTLGRIAAALGVDVAELLADEQ